MFQRKARMQVPSYDPAVKKPAVRCSICTGERVAGFKDIRTGKFEELQLIANDKELHAFMEACGVESVEYLY